MITAFLLASLLGPFDDAADKVRFPDAETQKAWAARSDTHQKLMNFITDRRGWARAFETIDGKLGVFPATVDIQLTLDEADNARFAWSRGHDGHGIVTFNMKLLVPHQKKMDDVDEEIRSGRLAKWIVPPQRLETLLIHELTHVVCGVIEETWLTEGLATYAAGDESFFYSFNRRGGQVGLLSGTVSQNDAYPRGMAFFRWVEQAQGADRLKKFVDRIAGGREKPGAVGADVFGAPWDELLRREKTWSTEYISRFKTAQ